MTDHTEMQIPDDVMEAARRVVVDDLGMDLPGKLQSSYINCIAEAILAERERCARIAEEYNQGIFAAEAIRGFEF